MMKSSYLIIGEETRTKTNNTIYIARPKCESTIINDSYQAYVADPNCLTGHRLEKCIGLKIPDSPTQADISNIERYILQAPLRESECDDGIRSLGFWYSPDGQCHSAEKIIEKLNKHFIKSITHTTMDPRLIMKAYTKKHLPKIAYILHGANTSQSFLER